LIERNAEEYFKGDKACSTESAKMGKPISKVRNENFEKN
jgi:hypothetical protein